MCQADAGIDVSQGEPVAPLPKRPRSEYDPDEDPDLSLEPDFGDLMSCIIAFYPDAKDDEVAQKVTEFLFGAAAVTNKLEFVRLKFFKEMRSCEKQVNEKVSKLSGGPGKTLPVWPRCKNFYKVNIYPDSVKVNPRITELTYMKNVPSTLTLSFSASEALALDKALAELVQAQSFTFWLLSSFFAFLDQEDFAPSNTSLF